MSDQEQHPLIGQLKDQLDSLQTYLDKLELKANLAAMDAGDAIETLNKRVDGALQRFRQLAAIKVDRWQDTLQSEWHETRDDAEQLVGKLEESLENIKKKLQED